MDQAPHSVTLELIDALPPEVEAGVELELRVCATCPEGCDLDGGTVSAEGADRSLVIGALAHAAADAGDEDRGDEPEAVARLLLRVPAMAGTATWTVTYADRPAEESGSDARGDRAGAVHESIVTTVRTEVVPHSPSLAVWDVPSPVGGRPFAVKVGVKCSASCPLGGEAVELRDEAGRKLGEARLGDAPRQGTVALYEGEVSLEAPLEPGVYTRSVAFKAGDLPLPHHEAEGTFTFRVVERPEHTVTVRVLPKGIEGPFDRIDVFLGPYAGRTDEHGVAKIAVAAGTYVLDAWRVDMEPVEKELDVNGDVSIEIEAEPRKVVDEDERYSQ